MTIKKQLKIYSYDDDTQSQSCSQLTKCGLCAITKQKCTEYCDNTTQNATNNVYLTFNSEDYMLKCTEDAGSKTPKGDFGNIFDGE